jgi:hypothetical protein
MAYVRRSVCCRECREEATARARNLCWRCYTVPSILAKYPSTRSAGNTNSYEGPRARPGRRYAVPASPTDAQPGSREKIVVMQARLEAGEQLHHPLDRRCMVVGEERCLHSRSLGLRSRGDGRADHGRELVV